MGGGRLREVVSIVGLNQVAWGSVLSLSNSTALIKHKRSIEPLLGCL